MKNYLGDDKYQIICNQCKSVIGIDDEDCELSWSHRDLNRGHECADCKNKRERAYDDYVDPLNKHH